MNRRLLTLGTFAGGIAASALVGMSAAHADDTYVYTLGPASYFDPTTDDGAQNISTSPFQEVLSGNSYIDVKDVTTGTSYDDYQLYGNGTETLNPYTGAVESWNLIETNDADLATYGLTAGSQIDVMEFGSGFANQLVDIPAATAGDLSTITDTLITPFGDFTLFSF